MTDDYDILFAATLTKIALFILAFLPVLAGLFMCLLVYVIIIGQCLVKVLH